MRSETITVDYPDSKDDCSDLNCSKCGFLVRYLLEDIPFSCYDRKKSCKFWSD